MFTLWCASTPPSDLKQSFTCRALAVSFGVIVCGHFIMPFLLLLDYVLAYFYSLS